MMWYQYALLADTHYHWWLQDETENTSRWMNKHLGEPGTGGLCKCIEVSLIIQQQQPSL